MKAVILIALAVLSLEASAVESCVNDGVYVDVMTETSQLALCAHRVTEKTFSIALGSGGLDKKKQGDKKTPLGTYPLGEARPSNRFFTFIPIGYPTEEQRSRGLTGSDVGIHGPSRPLAWIGRLSTWIDWTDGCIAVGSESEIDEISRWIGEKNAKTISIR